MLGRWGKRSRYPKDLRDAGRPDDPLFDRPLVYGRIDSGVVTVRRPGSDEVEVYHVPAKAYRALGGAQRMRPEPEAATGRVEA